MDQFNAVRELVVKRAEKRLFHVNNKTYPADIWAVVCDTESHAGFKKITFRSSVQVGNHDYHYCKGAGGEIISCEQ